MFVLVYLVFLPLLRALLTCRLACNKCWDPAQHPLMQEVYCDMCWECLERRHEKKVRVERRDQENEEREEGEEMEDIPPGCPTPPPCSTEVEATEERFSRKPFEPLIDSDTTADMIEPTTLPAGTAADKCTCPPVIPCENVTNTPQSPMCPTFPTALACLPYFQYPPCLPLFSPSTATTPRATSFVPSSTTSKDYFNVYMGIPKGALDNKL